ncbi:hypothetical protein COW99_03555 [Candidatus Roizmanbacteria bacterium CG22_combo_CG10-13_8_21_14_all_38_20]|uniref:DUF192 domain-containing protein n=1 Tax=Candidatus Roizmanbacteria bacterium CG22_combo_CG10-13_8_21_14_all_38_20 TaxID=1974862 RepID=A0A2H0BVE6_9BACT|nr:DUF192 domain-containing protein [Candidatus Microgenomates bacterium]PIP61574.1 MAG: hypothetical protein COW99_03555 [Candidatus Roizmanbacteria bacterium CG22_combo_CG10-13_8_21_14_all_38_20]PJC31528.1 MAG: hypothetical protein CO050_03020 [Candidatus Roizmanbacteria bacterium CG_4_9_14_0_2_um_filter_38_17]
MSNKLITRIVILLAGLVFLAITFFTSIIFNNSPMGPNATPVPTKQATQTIKIGDEQLEVEIMQTLEDQKQGLSGRSTLPQNHGMLFVYSNPAIYKFWMKDMLFPIDIIWISNGKVIETIANIPPPEQNVDINQLPIYSPTKPVTGVLEVNAGYVKKHNIITGDQVELTNFQPSI